jgi:hypothetical protein
MIELAEVAYNAYGEYRGWVVFTGDPMPRWEDQQLDLKEAWRAAVHAVEAVLVNCTGEAE